MEVRNLHQSFIFTIVTILGSVDRPIEPEAGFTIVLRNTHSDSRSEVLNDFWKVMWTILLSLFSEAKEYKHVFVYTHREN